MTQPKRNFGSTASLGKVIDRRINSSKGNLDLRHGLGAAPAASQSSGGSGGSGSGGGSGTGGGLVTPVAAKSAAYTATLSDCVLLCSETWTLALPPANSCAGLHLWLRNTGGGSITVDPDGAEQIDGGSTLALAADESAHIICDGSAWWSL
jgi:hypothetical protein